MTTKTHDPIATAQNTADKATKAAQDAHKRAQDAAQALESAEAEHTRVVSLVGAGKATADALATANHNLTHAREVAEATRDYAEDQKREARSARLRIVSAQVSHLGVDAEEAAEHAQRIEESVRALLEISARRDGAGQTIVAALKAEGVPLSKPCRAQPSEDDNGFGLENHNLHGRGIRVIHATGHLSDRPNVAGPLVAGAISRATGRNSSKLGGMVQVRGDHQGTPSPLEQAHRLMT